MKAIEVGRITLGCVYRYHLMRLVKDQDTGERVARDVDFGRYRVLDFATFYPAGAQIVIYQGLDGLDKDRLLACSLSDFCLKFRPMPVSESTEPERTADPEPPEKVAGHVPESWRKSY